LEGEREKTGRANRGPVCVLGVNELSQEVANVPLEAQARFLVENQLGDVGGDAVGVLLTEEAPADNIKGGAAPQNGDLPIKLKVLGDLWNEGLLLAGLNHAHLDVVFVQLINDDSDLPFFQEVCERVFPVDHTTKKSNRGTEGAGRQ